MKNKILLVTNGCTENWATIQYAVEMAKTMDLPITLLGVVEKMDAEHPVEEVFSRAVGLFQEKGIPYALQLVNGDTEEILAKTEWDENTYLCVGTLGRSQFRHWFAGRSFRKILENVPAPIFYVREARFPIKKILVCFSGLEYVGNAKEIGLRIGEYTGAEVKLLHVIPPVESDHLPTKKPAENTEALVDESPARALKDAQKEASGKGVQSNVVVRQGNIVKQILEELNAQKYDLICMGSSFGNADSMRHHYAPNVTAEIAEAVNCPILTARAVSM